MTVIAFKHDNRWPGVLVNGLSQHGTYQASRQLPPWCRKWQMPGQLCTQCGHTQLGTDASGYRLLDTGSTGAVTAWANDIHTMISNKKGLPDWASLMVESG